MSSGDEAGGQLNWLTLRFRDAAEEYAYQSSIAESRVKLARVSLLAAIGLQSIYVVWDRLVFSDASFGTVTFFREVVMNLYLLIAFVATWPFLRWCNALIAATVMGYILFFGGINTLEMTPYIFLANGMLVLIWPYLFITGDFPLATGVGIAASVLFVAILTTARTIDTGFLLLVLLVLSTNCLGLIFGYQLSCSDAANSSRRESWLSSGIGIASS